MSMTCMALATRCPLQACRRDTGAAARVWLARIMVTWGLISSCMMFVKTPMAFYSLRFCLGMAEANLAGMIGPRAAPPLS